MHGTAPAIARIVRRLRFSRAGRHVEKPLLLGALQLFLARAGAWKAGRRSVGQWSSQRDRKSTRLNSSHSQISYAVFCLKKKTQLVLLLYCMIVRTMQSVHTTGPPWCD